MFSKIKKIFIQIQKSRFRTSEIMITAKRLISKRGLIGGVAVAINYFLCMLFEKIHLPFGYAYPFLADIQIEPTKLCNEKCPMCTNPFLSKNEKGNMSYDNFLKIMKYFQLVHFVKLQGLGEIFLNPDIFKMIDYLKNRGVKVDFATNGLPIDKDVAEKLLDLHIDSIRFSIDTLDSNKYKEIRGVDKLNIVKENIERITTMRNQNPNYQDVKLRISMVIMDNTIDELLDMITYANNIGIENVIATWGLPKTSSDEQKKIVYDKTRGIAGNKNIDLDKLRNNTIIKAKELGINLEFVDSKKEYALHCGWIRWSAYITYDGYVTPCCHLEDPKVGNFGNILSTDFNRIWNGKKYREFRKNFFDYNSICKNCPHIILGLEK
jgi:radical SAM protein with 4Fe4S-binding SPASM domain